MAEALSLAVNIITVIHITTEVINRLNDFRDSADGVPKTLQAISNELPTLRLALKKIAEGIEDGRIPEDSQEALQPLIEDFEKQIRAIADIIEKMRPKDPSRMARNFKAVTSFRYDDDIKYHEKVIRGYSSTLSLERVVSGPTKDLAALQPPLIPTFLCPYGQDPDFVDRPILADILARRRPGTRHALVGGGGMGKSQLAISYGYSVQESSPNTWVFWVDAESTTKFEQGYRDIANTMRVRGRNDKDADILSLVYEWLRDKSKGDWVMILDNADDKDVFTSKPSSHLHQGSEKQIRDFLPQSSNGSILVTSRSRDAAFQVTCNYKHIFAVEPMTESEAMALLRSQLDDTHPEQEMKLLADTLGYVPLAISQAAANISRRSLPIPDYLDELKKGDERSKSLLDESLPQLRRNSGQSNSIVATWKVTFEYVRTTTPSAARLLSLMCLFDRQEIPQALLQDRYGEDVIPLQSRPRKPWWKRRPRSKRRKDKELPAKALSCKFEDDWLMLRDFSLIKLNKDRKHFSMHPMVQFSTKKWLVLHRELDAWSHRFISIMDVNFPDPDDVDFRSCEQWLAHAYAAVPYRPVDTDIRPLQAWASVTRKVACYCDRSTAFDTAQKLYSVTAEAYAILFGEGSPQSLKCRAQRCMLLSILGQTKHAEGIHRRILTLQSDALGPEHPNTLDTMDNLGDELALQRCYAEAEKFHTQALNARLRTLGPAHKDTQIALNKLGHFLLGRSRYDKAYGVWYQAYEARAQNKKHILDLSWANELDLLGLGLVMDGDAAKSERYFTEAIAEREKATPDCGLMKSVANLARALVEQGELARGERCMRRAFEWYDAIATTEYPDRLRTMSELSSILCKLDRLEEAEQLARRCLAERAEKVAIDEDREVFECKWGLAGVLERQGRCDEALTLFKHAFEGAQKVLGERHEDTKDYQRDFERLLKEIGDTSLAIDVVEELVLGSIGGYEDATAGAQEDDPILSPDRSKYTDSKSEHGSSRLA